MAMTKKEHIAYWIATAEKDWRIVNQLFKSREYAHCLFFAHLVLEKLCKAHWVKDNPTNFPPKIHNLLYLIKQTKLELTEQQLLVLDKMNTFQLQGRYPDYKMKIYKICNFDFTKDILNKIKPLRKCLQENLQ